MSSGAAATSWWWGIRTSTCGRACGRLRWGSRRGRSSRRVSPGRRAWSRPWVGMCPTYDAWRRILAGVNSFSDLEPALLGRVEELIDFVTAVE